MTYVCTTYIFVAPEGFTLEQGLSYLIGGICIGIAIVWFFRWKRRAVRQ